MHDSSLSGRSGSLFVQGKTSVVDSWDFRTVKGGSLVQAKASTGGNSFVTARDYCWANRAASTDLINWEMIETAIIGEGSRIDRFYSTRDQPNRHFRVKTN